MALFGHQGGLVERRCWILGELMGSHSAPSSLNLSVCVCEVGSLLTALPSSGLVERQS